MANLKDIRPTKVTVELGDKVREIKFDLNAFAELEKRFGTVQAAMQKLQDGGMGAIKTILWAGLIHEEAVIDEDTGEAVKYNITPFQVGGWVTSYNMMDVNIKLSQAMNADMPEADIMPNSTVDEATKVVGIATVVPTEEEKNV